MKFLIPLGGAWKVGKVAYKAAKRFLFKVRRKKGKLP